MITAHKTMCRYNNAIIKMAKSAIILQKLIISIISITHIVFIVQIQVNPHSILVHRISVLNFDFDQSLMADFYDFYNS